MTGSLVFGIACLEVTAVIRREQHNRVVEQIETFEGIEQTTLDFVEPTNHAPVAGKMLLAGTTKRGQIGECPSIFVAGSIAIRGRIVNAAILMMRLQIGAKKKKRFVPVAVDDADGGIGLGVDAVTGKGDLIFLFVEHRHPIGFRCEFERIRGQPRLVPAGLVWRAWILIGGIPFFDMPDAVASITEIIGQSRE